MSLFSQVGVDLHQSKAKELWLFSFSKNGEFFKQAKNRARLAAEKLIALAQTHHDVLLVGHGFINHFIAKELKKRG